MLQVASSLRFGVFELNLQARELRKHGTRVKLSGHAFEILALLLERPGEIVTREQLRARLWPADTFVDFEHGLNSAVKKLRAVLGDSPENSRYIETIPRHGYRFIAPVEGVGQELQSERVGAIPPLHGAIPVRPTAKPSRRFFLWVAAGSAIAVGVLLVAWWILAARLPRVLRITQLTHSGRVEPYAGLVSDGARLYYLERNGGHWDTMQIPVSGGEPQRLSFPFANAQILDVSPDLSEFLISSFVDPGHHTPIWRVPILGGTPRRVGEILARDAIWFPDGRRLFFSDGARLFSSDPEGRDIRTLAELSGYVLKPAWSEEGKELVFELHDLKTDLSSLWEIRTDGMRLQRIRPQSPSPNGSCCARWMPDQRYLVFSSPYKLDEGALWALRRKQVFFPSRPVRLTIGPQTCYSPLPSRDGKKLYGYCFQIRYETVRQDSVSRLFRPYLPGLKVGDFEYSRDRTRIAYITWSDSTVWVAESDGSHPRQVTFPPLAALRPRWSPDGKTIAFTARRTGEPYRSYLVPAEGGTPVPLPRIGPTQWNPEWSPDGASIVFQVAPVEEDALSPEVALYLLEVSSGKTVKIEGSQGYDYPRWSRDGHFIAALGREANSILLYDVSARKWSSIAEGVFLSGLFWSYDSKWLYYQDLLEEGEPVYRVSPVATRRERVLDFRDELKEGYQRCGFLGLTPDGAPVAVLRANYADIYAFDVDFP